MRRQSSNSSSLSILTKSATFVFLIMSTSVYPQTVVELSDGTVLLSNNTDHVRRIFKQRSEVWNALKQKCEKRAFSERNFNDLFKIQSDLLKISTLRNTDGNPAVGRFNSEIVRQMITKPFPDDINMFRECGVDYKNAYSNDIIK